MEQLRILARKKIYEIIIRGLASLGLAAYFSLGKEYGAIVLEERDIHMKKKTERSF